MESPEVTLEEAAKQLGCPVRWLRAAVDAGRINASEREGQRYVRLESVEAALANAKRTWRSGPQY